MEESSLILEDTTSAIANPPYKSRVSHIHTWLANQPAIDGAVDTPYLYNQYHDHYERDEIEGLEIPRPSSPSACSFAWTPTSPMYPVASVDLDKEDFTGMKMPAEEPSKAARTLHVEDIFKRD